MSDESGIQIYPVGVLEALKSRTRRIERLKREFKYIRHQAARHNWRAIRNTFNGYLAEWDYPPSDMNHHLCGRGWTKKRALKRLGIHIAFSNMKEGQL